MQLSILTALLQRVHGATFATLDMVTWPTKGIRCVTKGERVILFRTKGGSGYENKVKRRLAEAGKDPNSFSVSPLPWGNRVADLPLIENKERYYLQVIHLTAGKRDYFVGHGDVPIKPDELEAFGITPRFMANQDLPVDEQVFASTINIENISRIAMMREEVFDTLVARADTPRMLKIDTFD